MDGHHLCRCLSLPSLAIGAAAATHIGAFIETKAEFFLGRILRLTNAR